jgi:hypothetical protein
MGIKVSREVNGPLIKGLRELVEYVIEEGNDRIMILKARRKLFQNAETVVVWPPSPDETIIFSHFISP